MLSLKPTFHLIKKYTQVEYYNEQHQLHMHGSSTVFLLFFIFVSRVLLRKLKITIILPVNTSTCISNIEDLWKFNFDTIIVPYKIKNNLLVLINKMFAIFSVASNIYFYGSLLQISIHMTDTLNWLVCLIYQFKPFTDLHSFIFSSFFFIEK